MKIANLNDISSIEALLNSAYRGESSKKGWTNEADLISGDVRTDKEELIELITKNDCVFLKCLNQNNEIIGCVNLQKEGKSLYLGMLAVNPNLQGNGSGKKLLEASEKYAKNNNCSRIFMTVISVRTELINWYIRNGYVENGEKKSFPTDLKSGKPNQDLEFIVLEKFLI